MPLPFVTIAQMRDWEKRTWAAGIAQAEVIQQAGAAFARHVLNWLPSTSIAVLVLAGKGHNGDDARAAAKFFNPADIEIITVSDPVASLPAVRTWLARQTPERAVVLDGLFGIGLNRPLDGGWIQLIECLNNSDIPIASVDVPSGLDADTGRPLGMAVRAAVTVTFGAPKPGLIKTAATANVGRLIVAPEIGLLPCPFTSELQWSDERDFAGFPPRRLVAGHKGSYGHLGILAGSLGYHGAAVLAALGAQRAQPGLISLSTMPEVYGPVASQLRSSMVQPWMMEAWKMENYDALLVGPGLANPQLNPMLKQVVFEAWQKFPGAMVVDASALDWLPPGPTAGGARIITPHPGEAARLLGKTAADVQADRPAAACALSEKFGGCLVVLKGHQTLVGATGSGWFINATGNPHLAQGGAGDLLAGWLAGWLAQPALAMKPLLTARFAVWHHGMAADRCQSNRRHWTLDDLEKALA